MAGERIHLIIQTRAFPETVDEYIRFFNAECVVPTRQEPGCLRYELLQDRADPLRLVIVETWADEASLAAHGQSAHMQAARPKLTAFRDGPSVVLRLRDTEPPA